MQDATGTHNKIGLVGIALAALNAAITLVIAVSSTHPMPPTLCSMYIWGGAVSFKKIATMYTQYNAVRVHTPYRYRH